MSDAVVPPEPDFEVGYAERLARRGVAVRCVVLVPSATGLLRANALAAEFPHARVHVLAKAADPEELAALHERVTFTAVGSNPKRLAHLRGLERPQLVVDASGSRAGQSMHTLRHLYFLLDPGGVFVVEGGRPSGSSGDPSSLELLAAVAALVEPESDLSARTPVDTRDEVRATSTELAFHRDRALVTKARGPEARHLLKLRDWEADEALSRRYGTEWGATLHTRPATTFVGRGEVTNHGTGPLTDGALTYEVPELRFRCYAAAVCSARQVATLGDYLLPDTWRHPHQGVLNSISLVTSTRHFGRFRPHVAPSPPRDLAGSYYYLDTMFPGHFGHITTEVLGRVWGWAHAVSADPDVRPLISSRVAGDFYPFQQMIFDALDIPAERTVVIGPDESVRVERLYAASPEFENPTYVAPEMAQVFARLAAGLPAATAPATGPKIFVSRRTGDKRHCTNTAEVERFFADEGFAVVYPEDFDYATQKVMFERAAIIAGFGGSAMFTMMYAPRARVIVISSRNYNAQNERLFAAVNANDLHYVWGDPEIEAPLNTYRRDAFRANYRLDLRQHRRALRRLVR